MGGRSSARGRKAGWFLAGVLGLVLAVLWRGRSPAPLRAPAEAAPARAAEGGVVGSALPAKILAAARAAERQASDDSVAARNRENTQQQEAFQQAGWTMVDVAPPEPRLLALDPALLPGREDELRVQIASTVAPPELAPRLRAIALGAQQPATRVAAVEALGRIGTVDAQAELLALLPQLPAQDPARRQIVPLLRPAGLDDPWAQQLAALLDGPALTAVEKRQLAFTLALVGLRDGRKLPEGALSPAARRLIEQMTVLAQRG